MRDEYRAEMANRPIPIYKQDFDIDNFLTTPASIIMADDI